MRILLLPFLTLLFAHADAAPRPADADWPLLGNSPEMQHHSTLEQISRRNVSRLGLAWWAEEPATNGFVGNPLVKGGVIFQGGSGGQIVANDLRSGKVLWTFKPDYDLKDASLISYWSMQVNRGVALWKDLVIIAANCRLIAVDQKSGKKRWETPACDPKDYYSITAAPRVGEGLVFTGNACGDSGQTRGHVDAFDAATGAHRWRFHTVPGDPSKPQDSPLYEMAAKSWGTDWYSKTRGCGSAWDAITYDAKLHQIYVGVGGPAPFAPTARAADAGDELFTNSIVALDARTGAYRWHFKQVPHDAWNYEPAVGIMLADLPAAKGSRRVVLSVPKNGFAYVLDARSGKFLSGDKYVEVNWAKGLDSNGRPIPDPASSPLRRGRFPCWGKGWE